MDDRNPSLFNSEAQERLSALLAKAMSVVPFAPDQDCDAAFSALADFCTAALASKQERSLAKFSAMRMEELIALAEGMDSAGEVGRECVLSVAESERVKVKRRREDEGDADVEGEGECVPVERNVPAWAFEVAYNIVRVTNVELNPLLITVMARPPVAGNQKPIAYIMTGDDIDSVESQLGRNGTKLRKTLANALRKYGAVCETKVPASLCAKLKRYHWSKEVASEIEQHLQQSI